MTPHAHGLELLIRKSKTDQEGQGRKVFILPAKSEGRCPVKVLQAWLELVGIRELRKLSICNLCKSKIG